MKWIVRNTSYSWWHMEQREQPYKFTSRQCFCWGCPGKCRGSYYKILPASAKTLLRKCRGKMYFHIVTSAFYLPRRKMLKFKGCYCWIWTYFLLFILLTLNIEILAGKFPYLNFICLASSKLYLDEEKSEYQLF